MTNNIFDILIDINEATMILYFAHVKLTASGLLINQTKIDRLIESETMYPELCSNHKDGWSGFYFGKKDLSFEELISNVCKVLIKELEYYSSKLEVSEQELTEIRSNLIKYILN